MKMRMAAALTALALTGLAAIGGVATAQVSGQGGPVQVGSDSQRIDQQANTMYLDGRVEILQDKARLRTVNQDRLGGASMDGEVKAKGDVFSLSATYKF